MFVEGLAAHVAGRICIVDQSTFPQHFPGKVAQTLLANEAVGIEGVQKQLERLSDMLTAVQKALGQKSPEC